VRVNNHRCFYLGDDLSDITRVIVMTIISGVSELEEDQEVLLAKYEESSFAIDTSRLRNLESLLEI